jgi:hypothetical protein
LIWGAAGAAAVLIYGLAIERMRFAPPLVILALGGMTLTFAAGALWRMIDPLARMEPPGTGAAASQGRGFVREIEREKQLVLKAIKEIELDYQMRKIAERDYREMVERYRTRAMRLIGEIEAGDDFSALIERELQIRLRAAPSEADAPLTPSAASSGDGRQACTSCATVNDQDAEFCKKCGQKLTAAS